MRVAEAVVVLPPAAAVSSACAATFTVYVPALLPATRAVTEQLPAAGMLALLNDTLPAVLARVSAAPVQVVLGADEAAMVRLAGRLCENPDCVSAKGLGLLKVSVSVAGEPALMLAGENTAATVGTAAR